MQYGALGYLTKPVDDDKLTEEIEKAMEKLEYEKEIRDLKERLESTNAEVKQRLIRQLAEGSEKFSKAETEYEKILIRIKSYCESYYYDDITLESISEYVSMNKNYFCSFFKKHTGENFWNYITRIRIEKAKDLLAKSNIKANIVGEKVGYKNASHFGRVFKQIVGLTPAEYKQLISINRV
jgi:two-component system response regulator YesN